MENTDQGIAASRADQRRAILVLDLFTPDRREAAHAARLAVARPNQMVRKVVALIKSYFAFAVRSRQQVGKGSLAEIPAVRHDPDEFLVGRDLIDRGQRVIGIRHFEYDASAGSQQRKLSSDQVGWIA